MSTTLTIRNLADPVKQALRVQAARHGRSMEAEAREILAWAVRAGNAVDQTELAAVAEHPPTKVDHLIGIWQGRGTTDELMRLTRGED
jgi:plasmid stability protein